MIKLRKYAYKYWVFILLCIGFVFIQSQSELALPDYMSEIVTNGIQAGGFDTSLSEVLSQETYDHLMLFAGDDQDMIASSYTFVEHEDLDQDIKKKFPKLEDGYVLKDNLSSKQKDELETALIKPMLLVTTFDSMDTNSTEFQNQFGQLPEGMTIYQVYSMMDEKTKEAMTKEIDSRIEAMGESTSLIAAGNVVKAEYSKLGVDVDQVQTQYILTS